MVSERRVIVSKHSRGEKFIPQFTRKSVATLIDERIKPLLAAFGPSPVHHSVSTITELSDDPIVAITLHWGLADVGIDVTNFTPRTSPVMVLSPFDPPMEEQMARQEEGKKDEDHIFANVAMDLSIRLKPLIEEAGLNAVSLHEYNPTFDFSNLGHEEEYAGLRVVLHGTVTRAQLSLRPIEEEIQELIEPTRERWERFSQGRQSKRSQAEEIDLGRAVSGGYQGEYGAKPIFTEAGRRDGQVVRTQDSGLVNPCQFGDQAGHHACYCGHG